MLLAIHTDDNFAGHIYRITQQALAVWEGTVQVVVSRNAGVYGRRVSTLLRDHSLVECLTTLERQTEEIDKTKLAKHHIKQSELLVYTRQACSNSSAGSCEASARHVGTRIVMSVPYTLDWIALFSFWSA